MMGRPDWTTDPRFATPEARAEHAPELILACDEILATADRDTWAQRCDDAGLTWGPIQSLQELVDDPQSAELGIFGDVAGLDRPFRTINAPMHLPGSESGIRGRAPERGEHTTEVLTEAGLSSDDIDRLRSAGVVRVDD